MGSISACILILYSFLSLGVRTTPDHKLGRAHLKNVASRGAKLEFWKIEFLQPFRSKSSALYVKTPHFRAAFSALHLSSTHFGTPGAIRTHGLWSRSGAMWGVCIAATTKKAQFTNISCGFCMFSVPVGTADIRWQQPRSSRSGVGYSLTGGRKPSTCWRYSACSSRKKRSSRL